MYIEPSLAAAKHVTCPDVWVLRNGLLRATVHTARISATYDFPPTHLTKQSTCNGMLRLQPGSLLIGVAACLYGASGPSVPSRSSMHAMACFTTDVHERQSAGNLFLSLGTTAQNTMSTARKRLFWATGVSDAEQPAQHCSRKGCIHKPMSPFAMLALSQPDTSNGQINHVRHCATCLCVSKYSNALIATAVTVHGAPQQCVVVHFGGHVLRSDENSILIKRY